MNWELVQEDITYQKKKTDWLRVENHFKAEILMARITFLTNNHEIGTLV